MTRLVTVMALVVCMYGCGKSTITGDVYIVKGDGSVAPSKFGMNTGRTA